MADQYKLALVFSPAADPGLLRRLKSEITSLDDDFPHDAITANGVRRTAEMIEDVHVCTWRSPTVTSDHLIKILEDSGLSGYGAFFYDRRTSSSEALDYYLGHCFTFGSYGCSPTDWQAVVASLEAAQASGPLLEVRLRAVLPILARVAASAGVIVAGLSRGKLAEYRNLLEALRAGEYDVDRYGICTRCGTWAPHGHPEAHDHRGTCEDQVVAARTALNTVNESAIDIMTDLVALAEAQAPKWRHGDPPVNCFVYRQGFSEEDGEPVFVDSDGDWYERSDNGNWKPWGNAGWAPLGGLPS